MRFGRSCLCFCTGFWRAIATPEPSSPAPAKQHHKAFRSRNGGPFSAWTRPDSVLFFAVQISGPADAGFGWLLAGLLWLSKKRLSGWVLAGLAGFWLAFWLASGWFGWLLAGFLAGFLFFPETQLRGILQAYLGVVMLQPHACAQRFRFRILRRTRSFPGRTSGLSGRVESIWETPCKERVTGAFVRGQPAAPAQS